MAVLISDTEKFLRSELARLSAKLDDMPAKVTRAEPFRNLIPNGSFGTGITGWEAFGGASLSYVSGVMRISGGATNITQGARMYPNAIIGRRYLFKSDLVTANTNSRYLRAGGEFLNNSANYIEGTNVLPFTCENTPPTISASVYTTSNQIEVDNFYLWEADPEDDLPWLRLPFGHTVGKQGRVYRDGGYLMSDEYEEKTIAGQSFIKPIVAPGVNTEFDVYCGIGA